MDDHSLLRYSRQIMLPDFDIAGQQRLLDARVLVVGLGGLGCPAAMYLAAAGVGELWLADHDSVELSNLQRQIAHGQQDIGRLKVSSAASSIQALNPQLRVQQISEKLSGQLLQDAVNRVDLVVDASDNFATRFALNQAAFSARKMLVSAAAIRCEGQLAVFDFRRGSGPCYRCLYSPDAEVSASCAENGVLSPVVGVLGSMQALETVKILAGYGECSVGRLQIFDGALAEWRSLSLRADPLCPVCSSASVEA